MSKYDLKLVSDILDPLPGNFPNGPWYHLATVKSRTKYYMAFCRYVKDANNQVQQIFVEELRSDEPPYFFYIKAEEEWSDVVNFLIDANILKFGIGSELKLGTKFVEQFKNV